MRKNCRDWVEVEGNSSLKWYRMVKDEVYIGQKEYTNVAISHSNSLTELHYILTIYFTVYSAFCFLP